jgi:hypothetical protein
MSSGSSLGGRHPICRRTRADEGNPSQLPPWGIGPRPAKARFIGKRRRSTLNRGRRYDCRHHPAVAAARRVIGYTEKPEEWGQSLTSIILVFGFVVGCAAGAFAQGTVGIAGMLFPALLLFLIGIFYSPQTAQKPR